MDIETIKKNISAANSLRHQIASYEDAVHVYEKSLVERANDLLNNDWHLSDFRDFSFDDVRKQLTFAYTYCWGHGDADETMVETVPIECFTEPNSITAGLLYKTYKENQEQRRLEKEKADKETEKVAMEYAEYIRLKNKFGKL